MNDDEILTKTADGADEVRSRERKLSPRLRSLLIMVDGKASAARLRQAAATVGAPEDALEQLLAQGLVVSDGGTAARTSPSRNDAPAPAPERGLPAETGNPAPTDAVPEGDRLRAAQKLMNAAAVDAMGLRAFFYTLKLEKCFTAEDLLALWPELGKAMAKAGGEDAARDTEARLRQLLG